MLSHDWPIDAIYPNDKNPRRHIDDDPGFVGLVASVKSQGIIQPLLINKDGMILAGHRRYAAALEIGLARVPVRVIPEKNNHRLIPLIENLQRSDLKVLEVADYLLACQKEHDLSLPAIAEITGISKGTIRNYLRLAEAPKELRERVEHDDIRLDAAFAMLAHGGQLVPELVKESGLTRDSVRKRVRTMRNTSDAYTRSAPVPRLSPATAPMPDSYLEEEPSFNEYVAARRVVLYEYDQLRKSDKYQGRLSVAHDEMVAQIIHKSCPGFRTSKDLTYRSTLLDATVGREN
jgi:ParB/RepB/Spo0J family partition protein